MPGRVAVDASSVAAGVIHGDIGTRRNGDDGHFSSGDEPCPIAPPVPSRRVGGQTDWFMKRAPISSSTPTTRSIGIRGAPKRSRRRQKLDRPIFLSIGYSACHWCHVMEHESFEDRGDRRIDESPLHQCEGRPRRAARPRSDLHVGRHRPDGSRRMADVGLSDAEARTVLWRNVLASRFADGHAGLPRHSAGKSMQPG